MLARVSFPRISRALFYIPGPKETAPLDCFHSLTRLLSASRTRVRFSPGVEDRELNRVLVNKCQSDDGTVLRIMCN